jgi:hypothetical protein
MIGDELKGSISEKRMINFGRDGHYPTYKPKWDTEAGFHDHPKASSSTGWGAQLVGVTSSIRKVEHASTNPATSIVQMSTYDIWLELWLAN